MKEMFNSTARNKGNALVLHFFEAVNVAVIYKSFKERIIT